MDEKTKTLIDNFSIFLANEFRQRKEFKHFHIDKWSLHDFKITIKVFYKEAIKEVYIDLRELKDNSERFHHLLGNVLDQLKEIENHSI